MASPTTTIGSQFVGHWDSVPAHYHNNNGSRSYVTSATALTSQPSRIEFVPIAGCRIQGWSFFSNLNDGDFWNFNNSTRKPPGGLISAFHFADNDTNADDLKTVRVEQRDVVQFAGTANTGNGFLITLSRGTNTRGGSHVGGSGGGTNVSPNLSAAARTPVGHVPIHIRNDGTYAGSGGTLSTGVRFVPADSLRWSCYYFSAINNSNTWSSADNIPPPKGMVTAAWMPDTNTAAGDICTPRVTDANTVRFATSGAGKNGWLLVGCR